MKNLWRLRDFVVGMTGLFDKGAVTEVDVLRASGRLLSALVAHDDWLPEEFAKPHAAHHQEYLLHCDPLERFSVVSVVLGPSQKMPVHDHLTWCLSGVLRGMEHFEEYRHEGEGRPMLKTGDHIGPQGEIEAVSPSIGDIHTISNAMPYRTTVSIHVFGANIGVMKRHKFVLPTGEKQDYVSGYCNTVLPNFWNASPGHQPSRGSGMAGPLLI